MKLTGSERKNRKPITSGNNDVGKKGKERCALCRKRHLKVFSAEESMLINSVFSRPWTHHANFVAMSVAKSPVSKCGVRKPQRPSKPLVKGFQCFKLRHPRPLRGQATHCYLSLTRPQPKMFRFLSRLWTFPGPSPSTTPQSTQWTSISCNRPSNVLQILHREFLLGDLSL